MDVPTSDPPPSDIAAEEARIRHGQGRLIHLRRQSGLLLAPAAFFTVLAIPAPSLNGPAHRLAAIMAAVVVLWITEALPLPLTALLGAAACVVLQVAPARDVFVSFADPLIFLFIGAFILARALFYHRLDRRLAFGILSLPWVGARSWRILIALGAVTAFLSAWIANAATTAMMYAIAMSIVNYFIEARHKGGALAWRSYATGLLLMVTFAATAGGLATPIGAAPNLIGIGFIRRLLDIDFSFLHWCVVGVPVAIAMFLFLMAFSGLLCRGAAREVPGGRELFRAEMANLGPWTGGQRSTLIACALTVSLWLAPALLTCAATLSRWLPPNFLDPTLAGSLLDAFQRSVPEPIAALAGATILFVLPGERGQRAMTWEEASRIDWGIILLFGGGLSLGVLSFQTGLAEALGRGLASALPAHDALALLIFATALAALISQFTSNTAAANMVIPVVIVVAQAAGSDPLEPALGATLGSGLGLMLPVSTPCNAIVYSSGQIPLRSMMAGGLVLSLVGVVVVVVVVHLLTPFIH